MNSPEDADVAILRIDAPWEDRGAPGTMESFFRAGSLDFHEDFREHLREVGNIPCLLGGDPAASARWDTGSRSGEISLLQQERGLTQRLAMRLRTHRSPLRAGGTGQ